MNGFTSLTGVDPLLLSGRAIAAGALQRSGMIEYRRGNIRILDRARLEETACECFP
jgi:hypothetical protein